MNWWQIILAFVTSVSFIVTMLASAGLMATISLAPSNIRNDTRIVLSVIMAVGILLFAGSYYLGQVKGV